MKSVYRSDSEVILYGEVMYPVPLHIHLVVHTLVFGNELPDLILPYLLPAS
jgi:hypothetical protein